MVRVLSKDSKEKIKSKLEEQFSCLAKVNTREDYEAFHRTFCEWFTPERFGQRKKKLEERESSQELCLRHMATRRRSWILRLRSTFTTVPSRTRRLLSDFALPFYTVHSIQPS